MLFFFFKQKTAYEMRISDWSSDVCSSDLFLFEGSRRAKSADAGIEELQKFVDTLIVIPNQNLFLIANANTTFKEAFQMADEVLQQGVRGIKIGRASCRERVCR